MKLTLQEKEAAILMSELAIDISKLYEQRLLYIGIKHAKDLHDNNDTKEIISPIPDDFYILLSNTFKRALKLIIEYNGKVSHIIFFNAVIVTLSEIVTDLPYFEKMDEKYFPVVWYEMATDIISEQNLNDTLSTLILLKENMYKS